jgi:hypothetical protein
VADDPKPDQQKQEQANLLFDLFKEQTGALVENTKALKAVILQIAGQPGVGPDEEGGVPGLLDRLVDLEEANAALGEAVEALDGRMIGLNMKLSGVEFVLDRLAEIAEGKPEATPPVAPRVPTWEDAAHAKRDYDKKVEEEMLAAAETAEHEAEPENGEAVPAAAAPPARPMMLSNAKAPPKPVMRALPPPPVAPAPRP